MDQIEEKYLNEKFARLDDKLEMIHKEVQSTNGSVKDLQEKVHNLEIVDAVAKPSIQRVEKIEGELLEMRFIKKYPKFMMYSSVVIILLVLYEVAHAVGLF